MSNRLTRSVVPALLRRGLVAHHPLTDGPISTTGRPGTFGGTPSLVASPIGALLKTNGSGYVDLGTGFNPTAVTYTAWFIPQARPAGGSYHSIVERAVVGYGSYAMLLMTSTGKIAAYARTTAGSVTYDGTGANTLALGSLYFIAMTYDSVAGLKGYVNGLVDGSVAANGTLDTTSTSNLYIANGAQAGRIPTAMIGRVSIHDRALSQAEIQALYNDPTLLSPTVNRRTWDAPIGGGGGGGGTTTRPRIFFIS